MKRYDSYKDSEIYFLPELPLNWKVRKAKYLFKEEKRTVRPEDEIVTCFRDGQVTLRKNRRTEGFTNSLKEIGYQGIRKGDLVIHNMDAFAGAIGISDSDGKGTPVYSCCTPQNEGVSQYYYCYLLRCLAKNGFILSLAKGIRERSTDFRFNDFKELYLPVPPRVEQDAIVSYLDATTSKIDAAIAQQQKMIDLLNERKQIIINNAVTKGLDPNVKMKSSGVDWIGDIPEHWAVRKIKAFGDIKSGDGIKNSELSDKGKYPVWGGNGLMGYTDRFNKKDNAIVIGRVGALCGNVRYLNSATFVTDNALILSLSKNIDHYYILNALIAANLNALNTSNAQPLITGSKVKNVFIPYPPLDEQTMIVERMSTILEKLNKTLHSCQQQITLLQERKQIIINDVVTGKVKVV